MGYPMTYRRVVNRNMLNGGYGHNPGRQPTAAYPDPQAQKPQRAEVAMIAGDLRRLEQDQRDDRHLMLYASKTGLSEAQVLHVLDLFFEGDL